MNDDQTQAEPDEDADFYRDPETGYLIASERFLLERGVCCESGCRNCPWDFRLG